MKQMLTILFLTFFACKAYAWYGVSPYAYCAGDPVNCVDVDGDSVTVLINQDGAYGYGHMGVLLQNEEGAWDYYSSNGRHESPTIGVGNYSSPEDFLLSSAGSSYTQAFVIGDGKSYEKEAIEKFTELVKLPYSTLFNNCAQVVQETLKAANLPSGYPMPSRYGNAQYEGINLFFQTIVPNRIFENIVNQNTNLGKNQSGNNQTRMISR